MMNRGSSRDSLIGAGARNLNTSINHNSLTNGMLPNRRGMPFTKTNAAENFNTNSNSNVDLFSRNRHSLPAASSDESDLQARLARLSVGSAKPAKSILDDLLSSTEGGKNDYDWLLTPPGTPLFPSVDTKEPQPTATPVTTRSRSSVRSSSINKTSRLSVSQSETTNHPSRPTRSSSVTRSAISTTNQYTNYSNNRNTNILNTSSASVSSYIRPSTPTNRNSRPATPSSTTRSTPSRASTPSRTRPLSTTNQTPSTTTTRSSQITRPSTPSSRPQTPTIRQSSRPSTPTRRNLTPSLSPSTTSNPRSVGSATIPRNVGSTSRPSSPSPRVRQPPPPPQPQPQSQPINPVDFSHETPPNLRTTLPDRPLSAGRSRPGGLTSKGNNVETSNTASITRRHSSPIVTRGRIVEPPGRGRSHVNGHTVESLEPRRSLESLSRKPVKSSSSENGGSTGGFGRNISKKSLDMAIKHMDIRNGGVRPLSGSTLFPQSIRSGNSRTPPGRALSAPGSVDGENGNYSNNNNINNNNTSNGYSWNRGLTHHVEDQSSHSSKLSSEVDIYESSRYDAILLKEDLKNTSWLHGGDDKTDQGLLFDNGFESLPEPFGPL